MRVVREFASHYVLKDVTRPYCMTINVIPYAILNLATTIMGIACLFRNVLPVNTELTIDA